MPAGRKADIINTEPYKAAQKEIEKMLRQGYNVYEIYASILVELPEMTNDQFRMMVRSAYEHAKVTIHRNREFVFKQHMNRYERIYQKALEDVENLDAKKDWAIITSKYVSAMKALKSKEDLLGLHDKNVVIEITEDEATMKLKPETRGRMPFDFEALTFEEMKELVALIKEAKISEEDGVRKLVVKKHAPNLINEIPSPVEQSNVIDVVYEEMPAKVVDQLQAITIEAEKEQPLPEQIKVIDKRNGLVQKDGQGFENVKHKINKSLAEQFEQALKGKKQQS